MHHAALTFRQECTQTISCCNVKLYVNFGASVFWMRQMAAIGGVQAAIEDWQIKRDGTERGIVEMTAE